MFREYKSDEEMNFEMKAWGILIFAISVSLDSFGVGFTFSEGISKVMQYTSIFALFSFAFTFLGLLLGKGLNRLVGNFAILFGAGIMSIMALSNFINFWFLT